METYAIVANPKYNQSVFRLYGQHAGGLKRAADVRVTARGLTATYRASGAGVTFAYTTIVKIPLSEEACS